MGCSRCDWIGVVPGSAGVAIECPECDAKFVTSEELKRLKATEPRPATEDAIPSSEARGET